jgi:lysophospholipase L1-like esterase
LAGKKEVPPGDFYKGYMTGGHDTIKLPFKKKYLQTEFAVGTSGMQLLDQLFASAKKAGSKIVITYAPIYKKEDEKVNDAFFPYLDTVSKRHNIPFYNYRNIYLSGDHHLFRDETHLNETGSVIYSAMLAKDLQHLLADAP